MYKYVLGLVLAGTVLLISCSDNGNGTGPDATCTIYPMQVGNKWFYTLTQLSPSGEYQGEAKIVRKITGDTTIQNARWYRVVTEVNGTAVEEQFYKNSRDGCCQWDDTHSQLVFKYPVTKNYSYSIGGMGEMTVLSLDTSIDVPCGRYSCCLYQFDYTYVDIRSRDFMTPNVGLVRSEHHIMQSGGHSYMDFYMDLDSMTVSR